MREHKENGEPASFREHHPNSADYIDNGAVRLTSEMTRHPERIVRSVIELEMANFGGARKIADRVSKEENCRLTKDTEMKIWKQRLRRSLLPGILIPRKGKTQRSLQRRTSCLL